MSITFNAEIRAGVLYVTASGRDRNVLEVIEYGQAIIGLAAESGVRYVLCDERKLKYEIKTFDIFEAAKEIVRYAPRASRVAIVCAPEHFKEGKFWETVAVNRGLQVRMDVEIERAKAWLLEGRSQSKY